MEEIPRIENLANNGWTGGLFLFILMCFALVFALQGPEYLHALKEIRHGNHRFYTDERRSLAVDVLLGFLVIVGVGMLLMSVLMKFTTLEFTLELSLVAVAISAVYFLLKFGIMRSIAGLFSMRETLYIRNYRIFIVFFGMISTLLSCILLFYSDRMMSIVLLSLLGLACLCHIIWSLVVNFYSGLSSLLYILIYLFSVEILPVALGIKCILYM